MFIRHVDTALEALVRTRLPLPEDLGDVSFDPPTATWSAQLTRITVNFFLYDVQRSSQPPRPATHQLNENGTRALVRRGQPMVQLGYLVSAWAGSPRDEHQLLSDIASLVVGLDALPADVVPSDVESTVQLATGDDRNAPRELWSSIGSQLRACLLLRATVASETYGWEEQAPAVARIEALARRKERGDD